MEKPNDREGIATIPSPTNCNQIEVKHTPIYDINRLKEELTLINLNPPRFVATTARPPTSARCGPLTSSISIRCHATI